MDLAVLLLGVSRSSANRCRSRKVLVDGNSMSQIIGFSGGPVENDGNWVPSSICFFYRDGLYLEEHPS